MISYQRLDNVELDKAPGLPQIPIVAETEAMGFVPDFTMYMTPEYSTSETVRNMSQYRTHATAVNPASLAVPGFFDIQAPLNLKNVGGYINPNAWTFFVVKGPGWQDNELYTQRLIRGISGANGVAIQTAISQEGTYWRVYDTEATEVLDNQRIAQHRVDFADRAAASLLMLTFSVDRGLTMYDGGVAVSQSDDKRPLVAGNGKNDYELFWACRGLYGATGIVNRDLSAPENTVYRRAIEKFLMQKYNIPSGPQ